jgi:hypothetical protein
LGLSPEFYAAYVGVVVPAVFGLVFAVVAGVIIWHRSGDRMGVFAAFMLLVFGGVVFNSDVARAAAAAYPALWIPFYLLEYVGQVLYGTFFYVFPDGRFVPRWTRWLAVVWAVLWVPNVFFPRSPLNLFDDPLFYVFIGSLVLAQVYRYLKVSTPTHRHQTKWVVFGAAVAGVGFVGTIMLGNALPVIDQSGPLVQMVGTTFIEGFILLIPLSIGVAIVRSGLYEIDVIINRTLVYGSLTAMLVALYFGGVATTQAILQALTGKGQLPQLSIVVSTLAIAALFNPLRRWVQNFIDRSFYRRKYDAAKTLETFSARLRDETDLDSLDTELLSVVRDTMQPEHVSLWLQGRSRTTSTRADASRAEQRAKDQ